MIDRVQFTTGTATGSAGAATSTGYSAAVQGKVMAVAVEYADSPPATTDFTLEDESDPEGEDILSLANANSDAKHYPRRAVQDNAGNDVTFDGTNEIYEPYAVHGRLKATIAGANAGDYVTVTVWLETG